MNLLKKCHIYFKERFPIRVYFIFIFCIHYSSYLFGFKLTAKASISIINVKSFLGFLVVFLIFMQLRIFDDYKDYYQDKLKYPERSLSKGDLNLTDLKNISQLIILLQIISSLYIGLTSTILWLLIFFWSILMLKEFFMPKFLNNHRVIYVISHQLILPLICIYSMNISIYIFEIDSFQWIYLTIFIIAITTLTLIFHLTKKLQLPITNSNRNSNKKKLKALILLGLLSFIFSFIIYNHFNIGYIFFIVHTAFYLMFNIFALVYIIKLHQSSLKLFKISCYLYFLGVLIIYTLSFYL